MTCLFMTGHHNMEINIFAELFMPTELFIWLQLHIKNRLQSLSPAEAFVDELNRLTFKFSHAFIQNLYICTKISCLFKSVY